MLSNHPVILVTFYTSTLAPNTPPCHPGLSPTLSPEGVTIHHTTNLACHLPPLLLPSTMACHRLGLLMTTLQLLLFINQITIFASHLQHHRTDLSLTRWTPWLVTHATTTLSCHQPHCHTGLSYHSFCIVTKHITLFFCHVPYKYPGLSPTISHPWLVTHPPPHWVACH